jgi:protein-S-isoprenylcysteine O-methyltransferase Ste14
MSAPQPAARRAPVALRNLPLPEPHLAVLAAGIVLQAVRPLRLPSGRGLPDLGAGALLGAAVTTIGWATREAGTVDLAEPDRLVTGGPYAITRHPMYEAWTGTYAAVALAFRNGWLAVLLPVLLALVLRETGREDRRLRERFGAAHQAYARDVPPYLPVHLVRMVRRAYENAPKEQGRSTVEAEASTAVRIQ